MLPADCAEQKQPRDRRVPARVEEHDQRRHRKHYFQDRRARSRGRRGDVGEAYFSWPSGHPHREKMRETDPVMRRISDRALSTRGRETPVMNTPTNTPTAHEPSRSSLPRSALDYCKAVSRHFADYMARTDGPSVARRNLIAQFSQLRRAWKQAAQFPDARAANLAWNTLLVRGGASRVSEIVPLLKRELARLAPTAAAKRVAPAPAEKRRTRPARRRHGSMTSAR